MGHQYSFEKLEVWKLAKELVKSADALTKTFPTEERFGLVSQMNRSAVSVASTMAEGSARMSHKEQSHFIRLAYGSLMELACQWVISCELGYISQAEHPSLRMRIEELLGKLNALQKYQINRSPSQHLNTSSTQQLQ